MQLVLGWLYIVLGGALFLAQVISSINFTLAQKLGLQESSDSADPLLLRAERYVAYWDLVSLVWLPVAGVMMVLNYVWWPWVTVFACAIYIDAAGREAAKNLSFRHGGLKTGTPLQGTFFFSTYLVMIALGVAGIIAAVEQVVGVRF